MGRKRNKKIVMIFLIALLVFILLAKKEFFPVSVNAENEPEWCSDFGARRANCLSMTSQKECRVCGISLDASQCGGDLGVASEWTCSVVCEPEKPNLYVALDCECTDDDNGINIDVKGNTQNSTKEETDSCTDFIVSNSYKFKSGAVLEYFCDTDKKTIKNNILKCPAGKTCYDGACIGNACWETDSGKDILKAGTTLDINGGYTDSCFDKTKVNEFYCNINEMKVVEETISCPPGTSCDKNKGECVKGKCSDDDKLDTKTKGTTSDAVNSFGDECASFSFVKEGFCDNYERAKRTIIYCGIGYKCEEGVCIKKRECNEDKDCPFGKICKDGKCVRECMDSDGLYTTIKGTTKDTINFYTDNCASLSFVREGFCDNYNRAKRTIIHCGMGYKCEEGRCVLK